MQHVPAVILVGGLGTRLRSVDSTRPKPMVLVRQKPFLHWLVQHLEKAGYHDFVFSSGYKAEFVEQYPWKTEFPKSNFTNYKEAQPLGTGGAVKAVFDNFKEFEAAWIFNGDTLLNHPLPKFVPNKDEVHYTCLEKQAVFDADPNLVTIKDRVIAVVPPGKTADEVVDLQAGDGNPSDFNLLFDAGQVFVTRRAVEQYEGSVPCVFHDLIKKSLQDRTVGFTLTQGTCYDIGTPARLKRFEDYLKRT